MAETNHIDQQALHIWKRLYRQLQWGFAMQTFFVSASVLLLAEILFQLGNVPNARYAGAFSGVCAAIGWLFWQNRHFTRQALATRLNHQYNWLEFSAQLLTQTPAGALPQLQKQRVEKALVERQSEVSGWPDSQRIVAVFVAVGVVYAIWFLWKPLKNDAELSASVPTAQLPKVPAPLAEKLPAIRSLQIRIHPPAYTGLPIRSASELSVEAPENARIEWNCQLTKAAEVFQVIWNGKDTVRVNTPDFVYHWQTDLTASTFYQIRYGTNGNWWVSPVYTLHAIDDQAPVIAVEKPAPYTLVLYGQKPEIQTLLTLTDDYGLAQARLVATVSRGSGESVKFREVQLPFAESVAGKQSVKLSKGLDFMNLQMEPGDELYFYAEAWDQANPAQKSRSDTYFVQWEDTTSQKNAVMAGISLDNMPAYFRSQRQIIIDTEKLIAEKKGLNPTVFKTRCNDLGVDQKVLRLRYGQFLGEEFETNIGGGHEHHEGEEHPEEENGEHTEESHEKTLEQLHDHGRESNSPTVFGQIGDMMNGYVHRHDAEETATFFDETMKAQLKAALAQMWDAELRLRTMRPEEALPYEYKALELIKNLQQKSRVYVERVGFKPPPLKPAEKRLTGELDEVKGFRRTWDAQSIEKSYPYLRQAVAVLEKLRNQPARTLSVANKHILEKASGELAAIILQQPGIRVSTLTQLRRLLSGEPLPTHALDQIQQQLLFLLPPASRQPGVASQPAEPELNLFLNQLNR
jgi:hypothetical protein